MLIRLIKAMLSEALEQADRGSCALATFPPELLCKGEGDPLGAAFRDVQEKARALSASLAAMRDVGKAGMSAVSLGEAISAINGTGGAA